MPQYRIRKLVEDEWRIYKQIRLESLNTDPSVFGATMAAESERTEDEWRQPLRSPNCAVFALFAGDIPKGITGVVLDRDDNEGRTALLWGSWLAPEIRRKGLSKLLFEARLSWAREHATVERVIVSHRATNIASKFANQNFGFVPTHVTQKVWNDGITEEEFHYELML